MLWSNLIDVLRGSLFVLAHWFGGSFGAAILVASALMRLALLPVTIGATRRRMLREQKLRELAPERAHATFAREATGVALRQLLLEEAQDASRQMQRGLPRQSFRQTSAQARTASREERRS